MAHGNSRYPNEYKLAYALGAEKELLEEDIRKTIPYSTSNRWRQLNPLEILGHEDPKSNALMQHIYSKLDERMQIDAAFEKALRSFVDLMQEALGGDNAFQDILKDNRESVVGWVFQNHEHITKKSLIEILGVSAATFNYWQAISLYHCDSSPLNQCAKQSSQQITLAEARSIKRAVKEVKWNIGASWAIAVREKQLAISKSTFYKYVHVLGLSEPKRKRRKPKKSKFRAKKLHQIWHADITQVKTLDGCKSYIYVIIDNYSRAILSYAVKRKIKAEYSLEVLKNAVRTHSPANSKYVTDGGPENRSIEMKEYLAKEEKHIKHLIAMKDIHHTNSMIERVFKTIKGEFDKIFQAENHEELEHVLGSIINDYNNRPHSEHGIYTPAEVLQGNNNWMDLKETLAESIKKRLATNQTCSCTKCECKSED
ncbi:hypothetical protein GCM10011318_07900 [Phaeocystidibacter marisrubri]|uniref:DDE-type integrase/transposase/recombinase n=1 Tax=Phaeocystidibacter marisrubri TaxID=1577780 RepID=A0A6L3ZF79_9FLAO|nr:DDE-type integrase/transposase/recombinase [Phaeocystidibacter marisrubri]GGH68161.1 hypothetical protein GCM10011318_07900 [Phaeocystidibacter marisrubri]